MSRVLLTLSGTALDTFIPVTDPDVAVPAIGDVLLPLARFLVERHALAVGGGRVGVLLSPADDAYLLEGKLENVDVVAVDFPSYQDGRGYTHARHVREQLGFKGEVRAVGDIGADHVFFLRRCGCDAFLLREGEDTERAQQALARYSVAYQPTAWSP